MSIREILRKSNRIIANTVTEDVYIVIIIILVGFAGFGLGRLSIMEEGRVPVSVHYGEGATAAVIESISDSTEIEAPATADGGLLVASKNGSKYHYPWCSGAQRMKEENKIWFDSAQEAEKAGYTPATNCKGL